MKRPIVTQCLCTVHKVSRASGICCHIINQAFVSKLGSLLFFLVLLAAFCEIAQRVRDRARSPWTLPSFMLAGDTGPTFVSCFHCTLWSLRYRLRRPCYHSPFSMCVKWRGGSSEILFPSTQLLEKTLLGHKIHNKICFTCCFRSLKKNKIHSLPDRVFIKYTELNKM